jgi:N-(2-amino-2-carboxyethyl)-L-glutamate synthase
VAIVTSPQDFNVEDLYVDLGPQVNHPLYLKCEGFNFAGSIKLKAARGMIEAAEDQGRLRPGDTLVESSSGNLGIALSMISADRGYRFVCVTDTRCHESVIAQMRAFGAEVHVITEPDGERGLVGARVDYVQALLTADSRYVWLNQYDNAANAATHEWTTAREVDKYFPELDVLFVGAGTTGTLMGCARYFKANRPETTVVAVDAVGSTLFGGPASRRMIPGIGTGIRPAIFDASLVDDVVLVAEEDTVRMCRTLAGRGFMFGGSTGAVVSGAQTWLANNPRPARNAVAIAPDLGLHYLRTIYRPEWVRETYGVGA